MACFVKFCHAHTQCEMLLSVASSEPWALDSASYESVSFTETSARANCRGWIFESQQMCDPTNTWNTVLTRPSHGDSVHHRMQIVKPTKCDQPNSASSMSQCTTNNGFKLTNLSLDPHVSIHDDSALTESKYQIHDRQQTWLQACCPLEHTNC